MMIKYHFADWTSSNFSIWFSGVTWGEGSGRVVHPWKVEEILEGERRKTGTREGNGRKVKEKGKRKGKQEREERRKELGKEEK